MNLASLQNPRLKLAHRLKFRNYRERTGKCRLEGSRLVAEALAAGVKLDFVLYTEGFSQKQKGKELLGSLEEKGVLLFAVPAKVFAFLSETVNPQGILAVASPSCLSLEELLNRIGVFLVADGLQDPGNLGTIIRTAAGMGAAGAVLIKGTVDLFSDKVLRAAAGAVFRLPAVAEVAPEALLVALEERKVKMVVADVAGSKSFWEVSYPRTLAVVVGNENQGPQSLFRQRAWQGVKIPLANNIESLNAAMAAGILLAEIRRQHLRAAP